MTEVKIFPPDPELLKIVHRVLDANEKILKLNRQLVAPLVEPTALAPFPPAATAGERKQFLSVNLRYAPSGAIVAELEVAVNAAGRVTVNNVKFL